MTDVVLINGNFTSDLRSYANSSPAPGLAYIATVLEGHGVGVRVIDPPPEGLDKSQVVEKAVQLSPRIVGISCLTTSRYDTIELAQMLKCSEPDCQIVLGGPHATFLDTVILERVAEVDAIVRGEGEYTFLEYVTAVLGRGSQEEILGLTYRAEGKVVRNAPRPLIHDLDELPLPSYHLFPDLGRYAEQDSMPEEFKGLRVAPIVSSRGCPWDCIFCSSKRLWGSSKPFRARSAGKIVDEIEFLVDRFNVQYIRFQDDCFTADRRRVLRICEELMNRKVKVVWRAESRIDRVDRELLGIMKEAGCHLVEYGVETGSPRLIERINKRIDLERVSEVVKWTRQAGMKAKGFFMLGLPGETIQDFEKTLRMMEGFDYVGIAAMMIFPGAPFYYEMKDHGLINDDIWFTYHGRGLAGGSENVPIYVGSFSLPVLQGLHYVASSYISLPHRLTGVARVIKAGKLFEPGLVRSILSILKQYLKCKALMFRYKFAPYNLR
jgi:radical SAM superfamily enzyme YgiQ (UPF0313 family)